MGDIKDFRLDNEVIFKGFWALYPQDLLDSNFKVSKKAIPGNLELKKGRITLDLNGNFQEHILNNKNKDVLTNRIYGFLYNGVYVVLENCINSGRNGSSNGYPVEEYLVNFLYTLNIDPITVIPKDENKIMANRVNLSLNTLEQWYDVERPEITLKKGDPKIIEAHSNKFYDENEFSILNDTFFISFKRKLLFGYKETIGPEVTYEPYISVSTKNYKQYDIETFKGIANWIFKLINFLTHTYGKYVTFEYFNEDEINNIRVEVKDNGDHIYHNANYLGRLIFPQITIKEFDLDYKSIKLSAIKENCGKLISKWFENREKLEYIVDLYLQNLASNLALETDLINQIIILETYYDNFLDGKSEKIDDKDKILEDVKQKIKNFIDDPETSPSIREKIIKSLDKKTSKNITLREKLTVLLQNLPSELSAGLIRVDESWNNDNMFIEKYAERLKDTRNFYTHGANEKRHKHRFKSFEEAMSANKVLDYIIFYYILKALNTFDDEWILNLPFFRWIIYRAHKNTHKEQ
ncbi:HEPN domain-containing protein [uncultured Fenollaria sp.]|uniref:HEPN domain-containing protein n=1 Tax=uncultured Fenollaria sp. TaxID=1686315 RepID=UPI0025E72E9E|nr:HEPN domain-containing protein [uncultured Fenollaria sp.]